MQGLFLRAVISILCMLISTNCLFSQQVTYDWKHVIPGYGYTLLLCMASDSSGNIYVGGEVDSVCDFVDTTLINDGSVGFLAKFTPNGDMVWFKQFPYSSFIYSICFDSENRLYVSGGYIGKVKINDSIYYTFDSDTTFSGMFMARFDTDGNTIWAKTTAGTYYYDTGKGKLKQMCIDKNDNIVMVGACIEEIEYFDTTATYTKTLDSVWVTTPYPHWVYYYAKTNYLAKFDKNGQKLWIKDVGIYGQQYYAIATDYSNNILLTGYFGCNYPFTLDTITLTGQALDNIFIAKYNTNGQVIWAQKAGGSSNGNFSYDIVADVHDNIYITGQIGGNNVEFGGNIVLPYAFRFMYLTKYDNDGGVVWFHHYGTWGGGIP